MPNFQTIKITKYKTPLDTADTLIILEALKALVATYLNYIDIKKDNPEFSHLLNGIYNHVCLGYTFQEAVQLTRCNYLRGHGGVLSYIVLNHDTRYDLLSDKIWPGSLLITPNIPHCISFSLRDAKTGEVVCHASQIAAAVGISAWPFHISSALAQKIRNLHGQINTTAATLDQEIKQFLSVLMQTYDYEVPEINTLLVTTRLSQVPKTPAIETFEKITTTPAFKNANTFHDLYNAILDLIRTLTLFKNVLFKIESPPELPALFTFLQRQYKDGSDFVSSFIEELTEKFPRYSDGDYDDTHLPEDVLLSTSIITSNRKTLQTTCETVQSYTQYLKDLMAFAKQPGKMTANPLILSSIAQKKYFSKTQLNDHGNRFFYLCLATPAFLGSLIFLATLYFLASCLYLGYQCYANPQEENQRQNMNDNLRCHQIVNGLVLTFMLSILTLMIFVAISFFYKSYKKKVDEADNQIEKHIFLPGIHLTAIDDFMNQIQKKYGINPSLLCLHSFLNRKLNLSKEAPTTEIIEINADDVPLEKVVIM